MSINPDLPDNESQPEFAMLGASKGSVYQKYKYEPLPPGEFIRVLEAKPGPGDVTYHLRVVSLEDFAGRYEALSYVWGHPNNTVSLVIDGKSIAITVNLSNALQALRPKDKPRVLWIDAICVNQEDLPERGQHVASMGKIYSLCSFVPIWLGDDETGIAAHCFSLLEDTARASRNLFANPNLPLPDNRICADVKQWELVKKMAALPWFTRVWVLQEAGLAPRATLIWGQATMNISDLVEVAMFSYMCGQLLPVPDVGLFRVRDTFADLWNTFETAVSWRSGLSRVPVKRLEDLRTKITLAEVLHLGRRFSATDVRDHVFAFLGHPSAFSPTTGELLVHPDYTKLASDIYCETGRALIRSSSDIAFVLSCVDRDQAALDADFPPSWVPQWHLAKNVCALGNQTHWYHAGGRTTAATYSLVGKDNSQLRLRGFVLDAIAWAGPATVAADFCSVDVVPPMVEQIWRELTAFEAAAVNSIHRYGQVSRDRLDAFSTTLAAEMEQLDDDKYENGDAARRLRRKSFAAYCAKWSCKLEGAEDVQGPDGAVESEAWRFERGVVWAANHRRFFRTATGYYGLAHQLIQVGDVCYVFEGVKVPFILRPVGNTGMYKLVGDAYVRGVMRGEAIALMKDGHFVEKDVTII